MKPTFKTDEQKESIVTEYLFGDGSFRFWAKSIMLTIGPYIRG